MFIGKISYSYNSAFLFQQLFTIKAIRRNSNIHDDLAELCNL